MRTVPNRFVSVSSAAHKCGLFERDSLRLLHYPTDEDWSKYRGATEVFPQLLSAIEQQSILLVNGLPGSCKTFHALLAGYYWESGTITAEAQDTRSERRAFYGLADGMDFERIRSTQWRDPGVRKAACLWIVDDAHRNPALCSTLVECFDAEALEEAGHRLVMVGWSVPEDLEALPRLTFTLSSDAIRAALEVLGVAPLNKPALDSLSSDRTVGIREILWAAKHSPQLLRLARRDKLHALYANRVQENLTPEAKSLLLNFARLRFLGPAVPFRGQLETIPQLVELVDAAVVEKPKNAKHRWHLADDELARTLLVVELQKHDLDSAFLRPLRDVMMEVPELCVQIAASLKATSVAELEAWVGVHDLGGGDRSLLEAFVAQHSDALPTLVGGASLSFHRRLQLFDVSRAIQDLGPFDEVFERDRKAIKQGLNKLDHVLWRVCVSAALEEKSPVLARTIRETIYGDGFKDGLRNARADVRVNILSEVHRIDALRASALSTHALAGDANSLIAVLEKVSVVTMWRQLIAIARWNVELSAKALASLPNNHLATALLKEPQYCFKYSEAVRIATKAKGPHYVSTIEVLRKAMSSRDVSDTDVASWTHAYFLNAFVLLALNLRCPESLHAASLLGATYRLVRNTTPTAVNLIAEAVSRVSYKPLRSEFVRAVRSRIQHNSSPKGAEILALLRTDRVAAREVIRSEWRRRVKSRDLSLDSDLFWVVWNGLSAFDRGNWDGARIVIRATLKTWRPVPPTTLTDLSFAGLSSFALAVANPLLDLPEPPSRGAYHVAATSPVHTVCQFHALCKTVPGTDGLAEWLDNMRLAISEPNAEFSRHWHHLLGGMRRILAMMVIEGLSALEGGPNAEAAKVIGVAVSAAACDRVWDEVPEQRLEVVSRWASAGTLSELLERRANAWLARTRGAATVWLLFDVLSAADRCGDARPELEELSMYCSKKSQSESISCRLAMLRLLTFYRTGAMYLPEREFAKGRSSSRDSLVEVLADAATGLVPQPLSVDHLRARLGPQQFQYLLRMLLTEAEREKSDRE